MNTNEFIEESHEHLKEVKLLNLSGALLYSSYSTLVKGDLYLIGLNPGGPETDSYTIKQGLDEFENNMKNAKEWNAYVDDNWYDPKIHPEKKGEYPLQRRVKFLIKELGEDINRVCTSNLIFTRSPNQNGSFYPENADKCWRIHEMILKIVQPKIIIAFGNSNISPYDYLQKKHFEIQKEWPKYLNDKNAGHRNWKCKGFNFDIGYLKCLVIGLPHLSRYDITNHKEVIKWMQGLKEKARFNEYGYY
jgi:hypothetical protein